MSAAPVLQDIAPRAALDRVNLVLLGVGSIGRELLRQIAAGRSGGTAKLRVCGLLDRSGYVYEAEGISRRALLALCAHKARGAALRDAPTGLAANSTDAVAFLTACIRGRAILVDATAADTHDILEIVLERG